MNDNTANAALALALSKRGGGGGGEGGTTDHRDLSHRSSANQHPISAITGLEEALETKYELPEGGIPESDISPDVLEQFRRTVEYVNYTLSGKSVSYTPTENPYIVTDFSIKQDGVGLASPTNIRPITANDGLELNVTHGEPSVTDTIDVDFEGFVGAGKYNWNTGKLIQTYHITVLDGNENASLFHAGTSNGYTMVEYEIDAYGAPFGAPSGNSYCSHFGSARGGYSHGYNFCGLGAGDGGTPSKARRYIFSYNGTPTDFIEYLKAQYAAGTPVTFVYEMIEPEELEFDPTEIPFTANSENTATGDGIITVSGRMNPSSVFGSDELMGAYGVLRGKTAVFFGDSLMGNYQNPYDYPYLVGKYTGMNVINMGFGGCRMAVVNDASDSTRPALSMVSLAEAIATDDWTDIDGRLADYPNSYRIDYWGTNTNYVPDKISALKNMDWENVDYIVIGYGTNDFTSSVAIENSNSKSHNTLKGAIRSSIEYILGRYNHLKIMFVSPPWRWWDDNTSDNPANISGFTSADTYVNANGDTLVDFVNAIGEVASEYHLPFYDLYRACGWNEQNRYNYFSLYDGTHPNQYTDGFPMMARLVSGFLRAPEGYAQIQMKITDAGNYFSSDTFEGALQELGAELAGVNALVGGGL